MALNSCLLTVPILMLAFLLPINQGDPSSDNKPGLFWVAAEIEQCSNYSNGSDCDTLAGYQGRRDVNFSLSDTTWVFLNGEHTEDIVGTSLIILGARNVTLKGEEGCGMGTGKCALVVVNIKVMYSYDVTLELLRVKNTNFPGSMIEHTSNFCAYSVEFQSLLSIYEPTGHYIIEGSFLRTDFHIRTNYYTCLNTSDVSCDFAFTLNHCILGYNKLYYNAFDITVDDSKPHYHSINIMLTNSTFFHCHLTVKAFNFPRYSFTVEVQNVTFYRGFVNLEMPLTDKLTNIKSDNEWLGAHVLINDCQFMEVDSGVIDIVLHPSWSKNSLGIRASQQHPEIVISHSNFQDASSTWHHNVPSNTLSVKITRDVHKLHESKHKPLLTLMQTTFHKDSKGAAIELENLQGYKVLVEGNQIVSNKGFGLLLNNTQVEFQGYNEISSNASTTGDTLVGGNIYLSCDSQLLLKPHSLLNMSANRGLYGGGLYNDYRGQRVQTLNDFVDCYVDKLVCPGWCFFQFISSDEQYVNASEVAQHNATILLSYNTATHSVFNGHFQNCSLQLSHGTLPASRELISKVFSPLVEERMPSFPYAICLCDDDDEIKCVRNHTLVIDTYPVRELPIMVTVLGDWQHEMLVRLTVTLPQPGTVIETKIIGCTKVYTLGPGGHTLGPAPGSRHEMSLKASLLNSNVILERSITVQVFNSCSPGLQYKYNQCVCNTFLEQHRFVCTIRTNRTIYKAERPHYWIGIKEEHVLISPSCPVFFCNSVLQSGLTIDTESSNSLQCNNGRRGLLCSECTSGYSSVFGSFNCKKCFSLWLFQLPLYAVGGIFIVALLFLLNLTLLQGTIMGVMLYTNIMGLMVDYLQEQAWAPLFFLLSVLNLQSGAGVCFFEDMDEFWKALLMFVFPFYLFTLLIVTIIVTHKCGYRMFKKAHFIARRAVPVLATIMLLTYTSLVNAVIPPLMYTTLYDVDTAQGETVWLYQPSLPFFSGRHIILGILSIAVTLFYLIPFTFTMLFGDLMRRYFHKLWFSHFMDVLHGAFRWPLGFWIGLRLLVRVILVVINISTDPDTFAFYTLATAGTMLVTQLFVKPFRDPNSFRQDIHCQGPLSRRRKCIMWIKEFLNTYHAPLFDTLYLFNIVLTSAMVSFGTNSQAEMQSVAGLNILILMALAQFAVILVYHAYNFFPIPERARGCAQSCWSTMRAIPRRIKDAQCCWMEDREEEEPRRSPTPILTLRPPEVDETYDSESDTSSYNEQPHSEELELRESSLQEPLLSNCD